ncbi:MAG: hypothetical protein AB201_01785 [Parcubacteria bacterium C7867-006]|nr:MAG: hypothetical protein AB201_01785 [Parcubacteria bacterium C7867-006]
MSIENPENDKKINPAEIETQKEEEIWESFKNTESKENIKNIFESILEKLVMEDYKYYLEETEFGVAVKRTDNNETIYFTDVEAEIETLYEAVAKGRVD